MIEDQDTVAQLQPVILEENQRRSILIVEDDESQVVVLTRRLEQQGFQTAAAQNGRQGLRLARNVLPDLVLLDLGLPDMDGLQVCERLADQPETCSIPVIILSGSSPPNIVRSARAAGCTYFMHKPYDPNALLALIECSLENASQCDWE